MTREIECTRSENQRYHQSAKATFARTLQWLKRDRGAATAEYAVVTVAAAGLGGILIKLLTSDWFQEILKTILNWIVRIALNFFGFGG
ncbi:MAG: DUF4244 domain-containing protein [Actinomycetes bacterium]|jgi:hypothetical protein